LTHVVPDGAGDGGVDCGVSLIGVSMTVGGSGVSTIGDAGVGDAGVPPPHQLAAKAHQRTTVTSRSREGRARIQIRRPASGGQ
jgi:hypothetical protein